MLMKNLRLIQEQGLYISSLSCDYKKMVKKKTAEEQILEEGIAEEEEEDLLDGLESSDLLQ